MGSSYRPMTSPPLLLTFFFFFLLAHRGAPDLTTERAALVAFRSAVGKYLPWNLTLSSPCTWQGIKCESGRVTVVRLPGSGLIGQIPNSILGNLTALKTLSLRFNALSGPLPSDLASLTELRNLYLQGNRFTGDIPSFLFSLQNLIRLNLADNRFSGQIPAGMNNLTRLGTLYLENNNFTGQIPDLDQLRNLVQFNVSFNSLNGSIPTKLRSMQESSFLNTSLCGGPQPACPWEVSPSSHHSKTLSGGAVAGIAIGAVILFLILLGFLIFCCKKMKNNQKSRSADVAVASVEKPPESEIPLTDKRVVGETEVLPAANNVGVVENGAKRLTFFGTGPRVYDLEDLLRASAEVLGKGTFGTAYKAVLEMGMVVAVKRLKEVSITEREFRDRIAVIGAMEHPNLVGLKAYYYSKDERLLVYEYMSMGSLSSLLHGNRGSGRTPLTWETRSAVALAAAKGIEYIHKAPTSSNTMESLFLSKPITFSSPQPLITPRLPFLKERRPSFVRMPGTPRCSMDMSIGGNYDFEKAAKFPRMNFWDPYKRLGVTRDASEEEITSARNFLLEQYHGDERSVESIEAAYDKILMASFRARKKTKINLKSRLKKKVEESPPWFKQLVGYLEVPPVDVVLKRLFLFAFMAAWSIINSAETGPAFQVALSFGSCIYFLNDKMKNVIRASVTGFAALVIGWTVGSILVPTIPTALLNPAWSLELMTSLVSYVFLFLACTFLK